MRVIEAAQRCTCQIASPLRDSWHIVVFAAASLPEAVLEALYTSGDD